MRLQAVRRATTALMDIFAKMANVRKRQLHIQIWTMMEWMMIRIIVQQSPTLIRKIQIKMERAICVIAIWTETGLIMIKIIV